MAGIQAGENIDAGWEAITEELEPKVSQKLRG